jgi:hypothetical protein
MRFLDARRAVLNEERDGWLPKGNSDVKPASLVQQLIQNILAK